MPGRLFRALRHEFNAEMEKIRRAFKLKKTIAIITAAVAAIIISSCSGVFILKTPKLTGGKIESGGYVAKKPPVLFDDFEAGTVVGAYSYANTAGGASAKLAISDVTDTPHGGKYCAKAVFDSGTNADWGCGFGCQSTYGGGFIDATDREYISMWIKAPENASFYVFVNEANANGGDGEFWNGPSATGSGKWELYEVALEDFTRNIYSGNQSGNNTMDLGAIGTVGVQIAGAQGKGEFLFDDIWFK